ncbi:hypothetical protein GQ53DRAFT_839037 [Thozetella sp. PMI_491]|nr:hypothetical protein GQ53DRAFT_839037 [Thozetella sp. PMI_491]
MHAATILPLAVAALGRLVNAASTVPNAKIAIEASNANTTITADLGFIVTGIPALNSVSTLYLIGASNGVDLSSITCRAFQGTEGTGPGSEPFTSTTPAHLSTKPVQIGSIVCTNSTSTTSSTTTSPETTKTGTTQAPSATKTGASGATTSSPPSTGSATGALKAPLILAGILASVLGMAL